MKFSIDFLPIYKLKECQNYYLFMDTIQAVKDDIIECFDNAVFIHSDMIDKYDTLGEKSEVGYIKYQIGKMIQDIREQTVKIYYTNDATLQLLHLSDKERILEILDCGSVIHTDHNHVEGNRDDGYNVNISLFIKSLLDLHHYIEGSDYGEEVISEDEKQFTIKDIEDLPIFKLYHGLMTLKEDIKVGKKNNYHKRIDHYIIEYISSYDDTSAWMITNYIKEIKEIFYNILGDIEDSLTYLYTYIDQLADIFKEYGEDTMNVILQIYDKLIMLLRQYKDTVSIMMKGGENEKDIIDNLFKQFIDDVSNVIEEILEKNINMEDIIKNASLIEDIFENILMIYQKVLDEIITGDISIIKQFEVEMGDISVNNTIEELELLLKEKVTEQNFEEAAAIRDEIQKRKGLIN